MRNSRHFSAISVCVMTLGLVAALYSDSHGFELRRTAFSGGAVAVSGTSFTVGATVAETGVGEEVGNGSFTLAAGFWANLFTLQSTGVADVLDTPIEWVNGLKPNHPNPFSLATSITYSVAQRSPVELTVYDVSGRRITSLMNQSHVPGPYQVLWSGQDDSGKTVASGVYFCRLAIGSWSETRKMLKLQ